MVINNIVAARHVLREDFHPGINPGWISLNLMKWPVAIADLDVIHWWEDLSYEVAKYNFSDLDEKHKTEKLVKRLCQTSGSGEIGRRAGLRTQWG